ncbi:MAG: BMP family ABC transporter substrate-binding protein [Lachnospiraceae bacterium]|nr:BMP family ABC transporter substrate-binding protein [Lachnospiraceae bacterium]
MKKLLALALSLVLCLTVLAGCGGNPDEKSFKVGCIMVGDETEGYTFAHIKGIKDACKALGIPDENIIWKYKVGEDESCQTAAEDLINAGCKLIISNSYGHQDYMNAVAKKHSDVQFVAMTGDTAKKDNLDNFSNAFTKVYESRYVSGVVAGLKIKELVESGKLTDKNYSDGKVKVGYVGAYNYAEVVSGYTAFFLGIKSVYPDVVMDVHYTSEWYHWDKENEACKALIQRGCVIIGQHADSTGAPSAAEDALKAGTVVYSVGYNIDMLPYAPTAALTSASNNWEVYYKYAIGLAKEGKDVPTNWAEGYETGAVGITDLGKSVAPGTAEKVAEVIAAIKAGTLHVFDTNTFTVNGQKVTVAYATDTNGDWVNDADNAIKDGYYHESDVTMNQSAPSFSLRIDGITELN